MKTMIGMILVVVLSVMSSSNIKLVEAGGSLTVAFYLHGTSIETNSLHKGDDIEVVFTYTNFDAAPFGGHLVVGIIAGTTSLRLPGDVVPIANAVITVNTATQLAATISGIGQGITITGTMHLTVTDGILLTAAASITPDDPTQSAITTSFTANILPCRDGVCGDPQFMGLQGQHFQFHGMADEVFSLVSYPDFQMNSLFKYISSGNCDYNDTLCWTHPGTYLDQIGIMYGQHKILLQSGSHAAGLRLFINDHEIQPSSKTHHLSSNQTLASIKYQKTGLVIFDNDVFHVEIVNSDYFFNSGFGVKNEDIMQAGAKALDIKGDICELAATIGTKTKVHHLLQQNYPAFPLHGLLGQTWRNAIYCGRYFEGNVDDYITGNLFTTPPSFNYFEQ